MPDLYTSRPSYPNLNINGKHISIVRNKLLHILNANDAQISLIAHWKFVQTFATLTCTDRCCLVQWLPSLQVTQINEIIHAVVLEGSLGLFTN